MARIETSERIGLKPGPQPITIKAADIDAVQAHLWGPVWLYRAFSIEGELLYIGITSNPRERMRRHRQKAKWWSDAEELRIEFFELEHLALAAERAAIRSERPKHNVRSAVR